MKLTNQVWSFDSRDLMRAGCDHCIRLSVGRELNLPGLRDLLAPFTVPASGLPLVYGNRFEADLENELKRNLGELIQRPAGYEPELTIELMRVGVPVIYQGSLRGGSASLVFSGRPDFLIRQDYEFEFGEDGLTAKPVPGGAVPEGAPKYSPWDAKLSSNSKPEYRNQVALYCDALLELGLLADRPAGLLLGNRTAAGFETDTLLAELAEPRAALVARVQQLTAPDRLREISDLGELVCERSSACDICEYPELCASERTRLDHLQLVANITARQVGELRDAGVHTLTALANLSPSHPGYNEKLVRQASAQLKSRETGQPYAEVVSLEALQRLPQPSRWDVFFDIEGFTFAQPNGIEYLLGWITVERGAPEFTGLWSDDQRAERKSFEQFVKFLLKRRRQHPEFHVYHYAPYEVTALRRLANRYAMLQTEVDELLTSGIFVDLYQIVLKGLCIGQPRYSIKNLEQYYEFERSSDVKEAMGSMEYYDAYLTALKADRKQAKMLKRQVLNYNRDDCVSTLALRDWLGRLSL